MKRLLALTLLALMLLAAGCSPRGGTPKAVVPQNSVDLGDVPVSKNTADTKRVTFTIRNEGTGTLTLGQSEVKALEGC